MTRLYFLDWLRVGAFALLVLYHTGMFYVSWSWHVKSPRIVPEVEWAMLAVNPWRLALLFFISGIASRYLLDKLGPGAFARDRFVRLFPPLVFAMLVIVPPQAYFEVIARGTFHGDYVTFWLEHYLPADRSLGTPLPTWNHLWFIVYLLAYVLVLALVQRLRPLPAVNLPTSAFVIAPALWLAATNVLASTVFPDTHSFADDPAGHLRWIGLFVAGLLAARSDGPWTSLAARRHAFAIAALVLGAGLLAIRGAWRAGSLADAAGTVAFATASGLYGWTAILALVGYAAHHLAKPSRALGYLSIAILPVYVLHQTAIMVIAVPLADANLPLPLEGALVVIGTFAACLLLYEFAIRRVAILRALFGVKLR